MRANPHANNPAHLAAGQAVGAGGVESNSKHWTIMPSQAI